MKDFTNNQSKLALKLASELEKSGCTVGECVQVLAEHTGAIIGRHAPDIVEIERCCDALFDTIKQAAIYYHHYWISNIKTTVDNPPTTAIIAVVVATLK